MIGGCAWTRRGAIRSSAAVEPVSPRSIMNVCRIASLRDGPKRNGNCGGFPSFRSNGARSVEIGRRPSAGFASTIGDE